VNESTAGALVSIRPDDGIDVTGGQAAEQGEVFRQTKPDDTFLHQLSCREKKPVQ
jgi:hypothetical protein